MQIIRTIKILAVFIPLSFLITCKSVPTLTKTSKSPFPYEDLWNQVDSMEQSSLPKSALSVVDKIKTEATRTDNQIEKVKAIIYENKFGLALNDVGLEVAITNLEVELISLSTPAREMLHSYIGELYTNYLQINQWRLQDRRPQKERPTQVDLMSMQDLIYLADSHYLSSIQTFVTRDIRLDVIRQLIFPKTDELMEKGTSVYELLVRRGLDHFEHHFSGATLGQVIFLLNDARYFGPREEFVSLDLAFTDESDHRYQTMKIYQEALKDPQVKVSLDLRRLAFVYQSSGLEDKDSLYINSIKLLINSSIGAIDKAEVSYHLASAYFQQDSLVLAHDLCQEVLETYPDTRGSQLCKRLMHQIEMPFMQFQIEKVSLPNQPLLAFVEYKNLAAISYRLIKLSEEERTVFHKLNYEDQLPFLKRLSSIKKGVVSLPMTTDFRSHSTEFLFGSLTSGSYILLAATSDEMDISKDAVGFSAFQISSLAFAVSQFQGNSRFLCFDRMTGLPLAGVQVEWYQQSYDRSERAQQLTKVYESQSDARGYVKIPNANGNFLPVLIKGIDTLNLRDFYFNNYSWNSQQDRILEVSYFLDRSIYRPGQVLYFKGILLQRDLDGNPVIKANQVTRVSLYDANGQEVSYITVKSNAFGSFAGSFVLPAAGLLGQMSIGIDLTHNRQYFLVEAYKRPTFEVIFDSLPITSKLGELVPVSGQVVSYAGAPLGNVPLTYRVIRKARYPFFYRFSRFPGPSSNEREIASGVIQTTQEGSFSFEFVAQVDDQVNFRYNPVYDFEILVSATDVSGETQSLSQMVPVGVAPFGLQMITPNLIDLTEGGPLAFRASNANGDPVSVSGTLIFNRYVSTEPWSRKRYWNSPDLPLLPERIYRDSVIWYASAHQRDNYEKTEEEGRVAISFTGGQILANLTALDLPAGRYLLALSTSDALGNLVESSFEVELIDTSEAYVPKERMVYVLSSQKEFQPGDTCVLKLGTPVGGMVHWLIERKNQIGEGTWMQIEQWDQIEIPIFESDRGGFFVHLQFAFQNRLWQETLNIEVPWTNKQLDIVLETFRDVTKPQSKETIGLKVQKLQGEVGTTEVLASMYDASLDAISPHSWNYSFFQNRASQFNQWAGGYEVAYAMFFSQVSYGEIIEITPESIPTLNWFGFPFYGRGHRAMDAVKSKVLGMDPPPMAPQLSSSVMNEEQSAGEVPAETVIQIRENFNENLFFYPNLITDKEGNLTFEYQTNDALTTWRLMLLAHDPVLSSGYRESKVVTRKELMVTSHRPRFMRAGDEIVFSSKIDNLTDEPLDARISMQLKHALTGQLLNQFVVNNDAISIRIEPHAAHPVFWTLLIPDTFHFPIEYTILATSQHHQDAERAIIPVLENRTLITSTRAFEVKGQTTRSFDFTDLTRAGSANAVSDRLILDITSNPTWFAIKSLPYLMEAPYECSEQIFNRFFANSLGLKISKDNPSIAKVFQQWDQKSLESTLMKNEDLKSTTLEETPWIRDALSETDQTKRIANYFQENNLRGEQRVSLDKLRAMQLENGGFSWFPQGRANWFISLYIGEGLMDISQWIEEPLRESVAEMVNELIPYLDDAANEHYDALEIMVNKGNAKWEDDHLSPIIIYYLLVRDFAVWTGTEKQKKVYTYYLEQALRYWTKQPLYSQAQLVQVFARNKLETGQNQILASLTERMLVHPDLGAYWKEDPGFNWWQMPVTTHTEMIEVFAKFGTRETVNDLKRWLLNNKRTNHWSNTKSTSEAIRALTMGTDNWIGMSDQVVMKLGNGSQVSLLNGSEPGSFQKRLTIPPDEIDKYNAIQIVNPNQHPAWGAIFYQYFEDLDKIQEDKTGPLKVTKSLFLEGMTNKGPLLKEIESDDLFPGSVVVCQLEIESDRDMEFIHVKDLRAAGLEPVEVISRYEFQAGLGYYKSNTDMSTHFFIDYLPKGKYVLQYQLRVSQRGDFSAGNCSIQSMYAPEYAAHSKGLRIHIGHEQ